MHGIRWPSSNPKCLNVDFGQENAMDKAVASTIAEMKPINSSRDDRHINLNDAHENRENVSIYHHLSNNSNDVIT